MWQQGNQHYCDHRHKQGQAHPPHSSAQSVRWEESTTQTTVTYCQNLLRPPQQLFCKFCRSVGHECHTPNLAVVFQPLLAKCGTTEHFLFTNTYVRGLHLTTYSYLVCVSQPSIIMLSFIPINTHTHSLSSAIINEEHNCIV